MSEDNDWRGTKVFFGEVLEGKRFDNFRSQCDSTTYEKVAPRAEGGKQINAVYKGGRCRPENRQTWFDRDRIVFMDPRFQIPHY